MQVDSSTVINIVVNTYDNEGRDIIITVNQNLEPGDKLSTSKIIDTLCDELRNSNNAKCPTKAKDDSASFKELEACNHLK